MEETMERQTGDPINVVLEVQDGIEYGVSDFTAEEEHS
jgi:hypothetical protein